MSENSRRYIRALYTLEAVANRVPDDAWDNASCCSGWTAREVAGHAAWVTANVGAATGHAEAPEPRPEAEVAGTDPVGVIAAAVAGTLEALDHQGVLNTVAQTPFGEMPIDTFLGTIWVDPLTHAWDIADAAGIAHGIDDDTARAAQASLEPISELLRGPGRFGDPIEAATDDAVGQFIAYTGRTSINASSS